MMDACQRLSNGSRPDCIRSVPNGKKAKGGEKDVGKLRRLFDRIILSLLKDSDGGSDGNVGSFPALLIDGREVDFFRLFEAVAVKGGHKRVSKKGLWGKVTEELGFDSAMKRSLIQIYKKYLSELDQRVSSILQVTRSSHQDNGFVKNLSPSEVVEPRSRGISLDEDHVAKEGGVAQSSSKTSEGSTQLQSGRSDLQSKIIAFSHKLALRGKLIQGMPKKKVICDNDKKVVSLETAVGPSGSSSHKRKRDTMGDLLKWVTRTARHPVSSAAEIGHRRKDCYELSLLARKALFIELPVPHSDSPYLQSRMKIQPFMYDDGNVSFSGQSSGILRSSKRVSSKKQLPIEGGPGILPNLENLECMSSAHCIQLDVENIDPYKPDHALSFTYASWIEDLPIERQLSVGPDYQAEVPEWTGMVTESDPKWLGTRVLALGNGQSNALVAVSPGDSCSCKLPGSVTCTRFHIAEKRLELKHELGSVFYLWKFNQMGEEISLRWTGGEENRFMEMVRENPPSAEKCFWDFASKYLPKKTRNMLVSYYFNVFVLRRRSYQNRVTPTDIDSDDDDKQFVSLGGRYGQEATTVTYSNSVNCMHHEPCMEFGLASI